jgi:hypothetical protein
MLTEKEITFLEEQIPHLAETATKQAYWRSLAEGDKVMIAEDGKLIEVSPDGSRKVIKEIEKPVFVNQMIYTIVK